MDDTIQYLLACYLFMGFVKFMLCLPTFFTFVGAMSRLRGMPRGSFRVGYMFALFLLLVISSVLFWVVSLYMEGFRFFGMYTKRQVIRQVLTAAKNADAARKAAAGI